MCTRYSITKDLIKIQIGEQTVTIRLEARYNVAPKQKVPVIISSQVGSFKGAEMTWGWKTWGNRELVNAKSEGIENKPAFKKYIHNRCLIPADGFYAWPADKTPIRFTKKHDAIFCFAGLWCEKKTPGSDLAVGATSVEKDFILLTTTPTDAVSRVHNRMPLIVREDHYQLWFDDSLYETVLRNPDKEELCSFPVQRALNDKRNEGWELLRPAIQQKAEFD